MIPAMRIHQRARQSGRLHLIDAWLPALLQALGRFPWRITALAVTWSGDAPLGTAVYELEYFGEAD